MKKIVKNNKKGTKAAKQTKIIEQIYKLDWMSNDEYTVCWSWWVNFCKCMTKWDNEQALDAWCREVLAR